MASASDLQEQSLSFYGDHQGSLISPPNSLSLIVHESSNCSSWLVIGIIQQAVSENNQCYLSPHAPPISKTASPAFLFSFTNSEQSYNKYMNKYITDSGKLFTFVSFLSNKLSIEKWNTHILEEIKGAKSPVVIIENPELLLSIVPEMTVNKLVSQLHELQKHATLYIVTSSDPISKAFLASLLHHTSLLVSLTSLTTGRADDISGTLSVSHGPIPIGKSISNRQYSYLASTNAVKLYYK